MNIHIHVARLAIDCNRRTSAYVHLLFLLINLKAALRQRVDAQRTNGCNNGCRRDGGYSTNPHYLVVEENSFDEV